MVGYRKGVEMERQIKPLEINPVSLHAIFLERKLKKT